MGFDRKEVKGFWQDSKGLGMNTWRMLLDRNGENRVSQIWGG